MFTVLLLAALSSGPLTLDPDPVPSCRCLKWECPKDGPCKCMQVESCPVGKP